MVSRPSIRPTSPRRLESVWNRRDRARSRKMATGFPPSRSPLRRAKEDREKSCSHEISERETIFGSQRRPRLSGEGLRYKRNVDLIRHAPCLREAGDLFAREDLFAGGTLLSKILVLVAALAALGGTARAAPGPEVTDFKLANGLEVVVVPDHRAPVVTHMIWYKVGAADETPGKSGLAHFLEHLMFKGTEKNPGDAFSQDVAEIGGQENAFTTSDYTGFFQRVPREHLKEMMALEADRITGL